MNKKMKNLVPLFVLVVLLGGKTIQAQDCHAIVLPKCNYDEELLASMPEEKLAIHCAYAYNMFYFADEWPEGAPIYAIEEVKFYRDGTKLDKNIKIDLETFSYYAYNFVEFQAKHNGKEIYFMTPGSEHPYLVLRTGQEAGLRADYPERYEEK